MARYGLRIALTLEKLCFVYLRSRTFPLSLYGPVRRPLATGNNGSTPLVSVAIKTSEKINGQGETCLKTHADLGRVWERKNWIWRTCGKGAQKKTLSWWNLPQTSVLSHGGTLPNESRCLTPPLPILFDLNLFHDLSQEWRFYLGFWRSVSTTLSWVCFSFPISLWDLQLQGVSKFRRLFYYFLKEFGLN